jgi:hypothetical protein
MTDLEDFPLGTPKNPLDVRSRRAFNRAMQTLGLSESTPRTESRLKSLFWPSIASAADVDYLGAQGYWVCTVVAVVSFIFLAAMGQAITGILVFLFFYLGGVGVRERSRFAAAAVFVMFAIDTLLSPFSVLKILLLALLLSNLRGTWIAALWKPDSEEAAPQPRLNTTWTDKFVDRFPMWLWPKVRIVFYVYAVAYFVLTDIGLAIMAARRVR